MLEKSKFALDLIQAIAVVIGVGIAVNELLLHNRSEERAITERSFRVASDILDYNVLTDFVDLAMTYVEGKFVNDFASLTNEERKNIIIDINKKSYPILSKILALENCLKNNLCEDKTALPISCKIIQGINQIFRKMKQIHRNVSSIAREKPLQDMVKRCTEWQKLQ